MCEGCYLAWDWKCHQCGSPIPDKDRYHPLDVCFECNIAWTNKVVAANHEWVAAECERLEEEHEQRIATDPEYARAHGRAPDQAAMIDEDEGDDEPSAQELLDYLDGDVDDICDTFAVSPEVGRRLAAGELRLIDAGEWPRYMIVDDRGNWRPELMPPTVDNKKGLTTIGGAPCPN
jgi:hypothetical protein